MLFTENVILEISLKSVLHATGLSPIGLLMKMYYGLGSIFSYVSVCKVSSWGFFPDQIKQWILRQCWLQPSVKLPLQKVLARAHLLCSYSALEHASANRLPLYDRNTDDGRLIHLLR